MIAWLPCSKTSMQRGLAPPSPTSDLEQALEKAGLKALHWLFISNGFDHLRWVLKRDQNRNRNRHSMGNKHIIIGNTCKITTQSGHGRRVPRERLGESKCCSSQCGDAAVSFGFQGGHSTRFDEGSESRKGHRGGLNYSMLDWGEKLT